MSEGAAGDPRDTGEAYERAACGLLTTGPEGLIQRVNATLCTWTGFSASELVGRSFQSLLTMGSKLFHQTHWSPLLEMQGSIAEVQLELMHRDGGVLPVLVNAARRPSAGTRRAPVDIAVFVASDRRKYERELLRARKRAEELLERTRDAEAARAVAEARLRLALDSANLRVWSAELPSGARRYERGVGALIGRPDLDEVPAATYAAHLHPVDRARDEAAFAAALDPAQRAATIVEYTLTGADGVERIVRSTGQAFFDEAGNPTQFSGVLEDISDRRRAEEALRQRETEFRTLTENSPDVIIRFDPARRITYVSPAVRQVSDRSIEAFLGRRLDEIGLEPEMVAAWNAAVDEAFAGRNATLTLTYRTSDGASRELQSHVVPERNGRGEVASVLGISRDVTLLRQQKVEAQQRAVLAEQLIGIVSHDLRNPLNAVMLGAELLGESEVGENAHAVRRIVSSASRANRLIADLLDFTQARLGGGLRVKRRTIDVHAVVAESLEEVKMAWPGRSIQHLRVGSGTGDADPDRLAQVVTNLVNNALVYGTPTEPVSVTSVVAEATLELRVHNAGAPVPHEIRPHIFEPLRRGEQQTSLGLRSVGLGLYIVREIAVAHGGRVTLHSTEHEGTTFIVTVPRA